MFARLFSVSLATFAPLKLVKRGSVALRPMEGGEFGLYGQKIPETDVLYSLFLNR